MGRKAVAALSSIMALLMTGCTVAESIPTTSETSIQVQDISAIRAQDDFYGYINSSYLVSLDTDDSDGYGGSFDDVSAVISDRLDEIIREIAQGDRESYLPGSNEQLIYDLYYLLLDASAGTDGSFMSDEDVTSFEQKCAEILNAASIDELLYIVGDLYREYNVDPIFTPTVTPDLNDSGKSAVGITPFYSPEGTELEVIVLGGNDASDTARSFTNVLIDAGVDSQEAEERGIEDTLLLMQIGYATDFDIVNMLEENLVEAPKYMIYLTEDEIDDLCPNVGHEGILATMGIEDDYVDGIYIVLEDQLSAIDSLLTEDNLESWKDITLLSFVNSIKSFLPESYGGSSIAYSNDSYAIREVKRYLSTELSEEYVERYYDEETVSAVEDLVYDIRDEYEEMINDCEWMSDEGKALAVEKLMSIEFYIGADEPHVTDPSDADLIGASCFETRLALNVRSYERWLSELRGEYESSGFEGMLPTTANACYNPISNCVVIPLGIMDAPFYDKDASYYTNLGGIGSIIGHEISHAFDYHSMWFDMNGNYNPEWMPQEDRDAFEEVALSISEYYSSYTVLTYHNVDGDLTIGENMADISGLEVILRMAGDLDAKKEIFENFAVCFASVSTRDIALSSLSSDPHSPNQIRVNATVALFPEFYEIYEVTSEDLMYVQEDCRVRRW
ncbi:MAG: M13 family metallopeptidase [Saccharofermentans sp.]|nr:M13 family metallopeptidase [Saccharofermentans sp.]